MGIGPVGRGGFAVFPVTGAAMWAGGVSSCDFCPIQVGIGCLMSGDRRYGAPGFRNWRSPRCSQFWARLQCLVGRLPGCRLVPGGDAGVGGEWLVDRDEVPWRGLGTSRGGRWGMVWDAGLVNARGASRRPLASQVAASSQGGWI